MQVCAKKRRRTTKLVIDIPRCISFYLPSEYSVPGPGLEQVVHSHETLWRSGWPRGRQGALNPSPHS